MRWLNRLTVLFDDLLVKVYSHPQEGKRKRYLKPLFALRRALLFLLQGLTFQIFEISGKAREGGHDFKVIYFSEGKGMQFLISKMFENENVNCQMVGKARFWELGRAAANFEKQCDLVVVEQNTLLHWRPAHGPWVSSPTWVRMVFDLDLQHPWEKVEHSFRKHERNIRRMKRCGYRYEISHDPADFDFFYEKMYVPTIHGRHASYGLVDTKQHLFSLFQQGFLLFIVDNEGNRVAADMAAIYGDVYFGVVCGVLNNDETLLENGVTSALYYYAIQWCHENKFRRCDIGEARPFEYDGLYEYKRRWGYKPVLELWNTREWVFWNPRQSAAAREWLLANPTLPKFSQYSEQIMNNASVLKSPGAGA